jgi:hypothetical protein
VAVHFLFQLMKRNEPNKNLDKTRLQEMFYGPQTMEMVAHGCFDEPARMIRGGHCQ